MTKDTLKSIAIAVGLATIVTTTLPMRSSAPAKPSPYQGITIVYDGQVLTGLPLWVVPSMDVYGFDLNSNGANDAYAVDRNHNGVLDRGELFADYCEKGEIAPIRPETVVQIEAAVAQEKESMEALIKGLNDLNLATERVAKTLENAVQKQ